MSKEYEYLDLLDRKLDPLQKLACCRTENTIVAAGAGSGKTQVLATRFAWLVMSCDVPVGKILTLTFTKKAAAEMYSRIYKTLRFFADNENVPEKERRNAQKALDDFSEAHIQTLDSYCNSIVRQSANRYGIKPDFGQDSNMDIESEALAYVFEHRNAEEIRKMAKTGDFEKFAKDYFEKPVSTYSTIANYKGFFIKKIPAHKQFLAEYWNSKIDLINTIAEDCASYIEQIEKRNLKDDILTLQTLISYEKVPEPAKIINPEEIGTPVFINSLERMQKCLDWFDCIKKLSISANGNDENKKSLANYLKGIKGTKGGDPIMIKQVEGIYNSFCQIKDFSLTQQLLEKVEEFSCKINEEKRISGNLSFDDITDMSLKILIEQEDIRTQEKNTYSKIMIDEFQDNNGKNRDLLFLLSEKNDVFTHIPSENQTSSTIKEMLKNNLCPDKLYFVGDEKQSIYKFRKADVSVFNELAKDLNTQPIQMINNYRSSNEVLSSINQIFGGFGSGNAGSNHKGIFERETPYSYEATFSEKAMAQQVDRKTHETIELKELTAENVKAHVCMHHCAFNQTDKEIMDAENQQAYFIAKKIRDEYDKAEGKIPYSAFAILEKSRTNRYIYTAWLNRFGIPFTLDAQTRIFEEAPINDIYNYLKLCVYPSDTTSYAGVLASPFVNIRESSMEAILALTQPSFENSTEALSSLQEILAAYPDDFENYKAAAEFFQTHRKLFLSQKLTKTVEELWYSQGYYYETLVNSNVNLLAEQFDLLYEVARQSDDDSKSLAWFVDQLDHIRKMEKEAFSKDEASEIDIKEVNYPLERSDAVQVMTIHKSKGLQFNTVFVTGCTGKSKEPRDNISFYNEEYGLSFKPEGCGVNCIFDAFLEDETNREKAEFRRLLYVAITRAEKEFYIVGKWGKDGPDIESLLQQQILQYNPDAADPNAEICGVKQFVKNSPYDYLLIEPQKEEMKWIVGRTYADKSEGKSSNTDSIKRDLISKVSELYRDATVVETPVLNSIRATPSGLETAGNPFDAKINQIPGLEGLDELIQKNLPDELKGEEKADGDTAAKYEEAADTLHKNSFDYADFGTLAHAYLCDFVAGGMKPDFSEADFTGGIKLYKSLNDKPKDKEKITKYCLAMCRSFEQSELGKRVRQAIENNRFVKTEWAFRMYKDKLLFTGSIDLIFENPDGTFTIGDYKTDLQLNNEKYIGQQNCYRTAASSILGIDEGKINCELFYLRYAKTEKLQ